MRVESRKFEIFSGTGGVGKTTLATSRALYLAQQNKKVLLITIDPSKRLKQVLGIDDADTGVNITLNNPLGIGDDFFVDVILMNPAATMEKIGKYANAPEINKNRIIGILSKPYGGLNEILSVVELYFQESKKEYDVIVLDTPPGSHFVDFLESVDKIRAFFDKGFIDIFNLLKKQFSPKEGTRSKKLLDKIVATGFKPLLSSLEKVTGGTFVKEFIDAVAAIYQSQDIFMNALALQERLKNTDFANWFLVTSFDQSKLHEAMELQAHAKDLLGSDAFVLINKSNQEHLEKWEPQEATINASLKMSLLEKENELRDFMKARFKNIIEFPEDLSTNPKSHVIRLLDSWK
jgi:anion-transporting  ArsA/GET3 family ATPase